MKMKTLDFVDDALDDFVLWNEQIEDEIDVKLIRLSQAKNVGKPRHSLDEVRAKLGLKA